jgi:hypothetical protein
VGKHEVSDKDKIFRDSIGQKAGVSREQFEGEAAAEYAQRLHDLGLSIGAEPMFGVTGYQYRGSAAVHIYSHEILDSICFMPQVKALLMQRCPEELAARAFEDLLRSMKAAYGKTHGKLRSGF